MLRRQPLVDEGRAKGYVKEIFLYYYCTPHLGQGIGLGRTQGRTKRGKKFGCFLPYPFFVYSLSYFSLNLLFLPETDLKQI